MRTMDTRALPGQDRSVLKVIRISCAEEREQRPRVVRGVLGSAVDERCGAGSAASSLFSASLRVVTATKQALGNDAEMSVSR